MNFITRTIPKEGMLPEENEDAFLFSESNLIFAIADGATESSFSKHWANLLVEDFVNNYNSYITNNAIMPSEKMVAFLEEKISTKKLPWYAEEKAMMGASAAFLGIAFNQIPESMDFEWHACAVGDCNLFVIRNNRLELAFPLVNAIEFSNRPTLINSTIEFQHQKKHQFKNSKGNLIKEDVLFLMTDAIAKWFIERTGNMEVTPEADNPLNTIELMISSEDKFEKMVGQLRKSKELRNDDTTIVKVSF